MKPCGCPIIEYRQILNYVKCFKCNTYTYHVNQCGGCAVIMAVCDSCAFFYNDDYDEPFCCEECFRRFMNE